MIREKIDPATLKAVFTVAGGEAIDASRFERETTGTPILRSEILCSLDYFAAVFERR